MVECHPTRPPTFTSGRYLGGRCDKVGAETRRLPRPALPVYALPADRPPVGKAGAPVGRAGAVDAAQIRRHQLLSSWVVQKVLRRRRPTTECSHPPQYFNPAPRYQCQERFPRWTSFPQVCIFFGFGKRYLHDECQQYSCTQRLFVHNDAFYMVRCFILGLARVLVGKGSFVLC